MKIKRVLMAVIPIALVFAVCLHGHDELRDFPVGRTHMVYELRSAEKAEAQYQIITVTGLADGRYRLLLTIEAVGAADELSLAHLMAGMWMGYAGGAAMGIDALIARREHLVVGNEYRLPGGVRFTVVAVVEIAGVRALQGILTDPDSPDTRTILAFAMDDPVLLLPLIRVERKEDGVWRVIHSIELIEYTFTLPEGG